MSKVNVVYHHFPHYRAPVMRELVKNGIHDYQFWGSLESTEGIKAFQGDDLVTINPLRFRVSGSAWILKDYWPAVFDRSTDAIIVLGNPNMLATWKIAVVARLMGKKVLFWSHGWLKREGAAKRFLRNFYLGLANKVLVYGPRAKQLGMANGFSADRINVIYNSLDYDKSQKIMAGLQSGAAADAVRAQDLFANTERPLIICTARVTETCRFDLLFKAAEKLKAQNNPINILLVGDGPERQPLEAMASDLGLSVHFYGACYDENVVAGLIYNADLTVSPGKIGLTVIHSLSYGTPAITHDNLDEQMPEVEAIAPGVTGALFRYNNADDLADKILDWLNSGRDRQLVRQECQKVVADIWNPAKQRELIDEAVTEVMGKRAR